MNLYRCMLTFALLMTVGGRLAAQTADSVDVLHYDITLDLSQRPVRGDATLTLRLLQPCNTIALDYVLGIDSVAVDGSVVAGADLAALPMASHSVDDTVTVRVWYYTYGYVESGGWGGLHVDNDMTYNLGVGFDDDPHIMGRAWFPCRDNFYDKATYTLNVTTKAGWTAECGGSCQNRSVDVGNKEHSQWHISQPTPTYLVSVSQANWKRVYDTVTSVYGDYPATYGYLYPSQSQVQAAFAQLDSVMPMFERCFGPYRWGRIGYIATAKGSMEHVNNIALARQALTSSEEFAKTTIAHELGHAWFGNLVTCLTAGDMWINEGGASFTSEVGMEAYMGRAWSDDYYQRNLESVLRTAHVNDGGHYRPLHGVPHRYTYGRTSYDKGWMVWHSLRGYLGEERFYAALRQLMERCAFGNVDASALRDSLSLYSGVDLTPFFAFHVFSPGFVDYDVDVTAAELPATVSVAISQRSVGTTATAYANRVPVTFFSVTLDTCKRWFSFAGTDTVVSGITLPFEPAFWVLDYDKEISDAVTIGEAHLGAEGGNASLAVAHAAVSAATPADVYVEHHWSPADGMPYGVQRSAQRRWRVTGQWQGAVEGRFRFVRTGHSSNYNDLDRGFYSQAASVDSLWLLFRPQGGTEWQLVARQMTGNANEGYLVTDSLRAGEYTIVVVDTARMGIEVMGMTPQNSTLRLFPNPVGQGQPITLLTECPAPYSVTVSDEGGRIVWQHDAWRDGRPLPLSLQKGIYFVRIENNLLSLQSKLIQL